MSSSRTCDFCFVRKITTKINKYHLCGKCSIYEGTFTKEVEDFSGEGTLFVINLIMSSGAFQHIPKDIKLIILEKAGIKLKYFEFWGCYNVFHNTGMAAMLKTWCPEPN